MSNKYFEIPLEFNHQILEDSIEDLAFKGKGYCCFVDLNSLVNAHYNNDFKEVINKSYINSCDGSYIAMIASKLHGESLKEYIGPEFFEKFIFKKGKHLILGNTENVYHKITERINSEGGNSKNLNYLPLPFKPVEEFDYDGISEYINNYNPNYIWVSLGAPKQEFFMSNLLPYINQGVLMGVGAAFNYFSGEIKQIPNWAKKLHIIWLYRIFTEPKKQLRRCKDIFIALPNIIAKEKNNL